MKKIKDFKNKATNIAGIMVLVAGVVASIATAGIALPAVVLTTATILGTTGLSVIAYLTGKNGDGSVKKNE